MKVCLGATAFADPGRCQAVFTLDGRRAMAQPTACGNCGGEIAGDGENIGRLKSDTSPAVGALCTCRGVFESSWLMRSTSGGATHDVQTLIAIVRGTACRRGEAPCTARPDTASSPSERI